jgi:hypothetical protein
MVPVYRAESGTNQRLTHEGVVKSGKPNWEKQTLFVNVGGNVRDTEDFAMIKLQRDSRVKFDKIRKTINNPKMPRDKKADFLKKQFGVDVVPELRTKGMYARSIT